MTFYVVEKDGSEVGGFGATITWKEDGEETESFKNYKAALKRAKDLSKHNVNTTYEILQTVTRIYHVPTDPIVENVIPVVD